MALNLKIHKGKKKKEGKRTDAISRASASSSFKAVSRQQAAVAQAGQSYYNNEISINHVPMAFNIRHPVLKKQSVALIGSKSFNVSPGRENRPKSRQKPERRNDIFLEHDHVYRNTVLYEENQKNYKDKRP